MATPFDTSKPSDRADRLDQVGWGIFLMMLGTIWLLPHVPAGTLLGGTGVLLLGLNAVRRQVGIHVSGISVVLGTVALAAGLAELAGVTLPLFPICLVVVGASLIVRPLLRAHA
jgi:hypothetical protein